MVRIFLSFYPLSSRKFGFWEEILIYLLELVKYAVPMNNTKKSSRELYVSPEISFLFEFSSCICDGSNGISMGDIKDENISWE